MIDGRLQEPIRDIDVALLASTSGGSSGPSSPQGSDDGVIIVYSARKSLSKRKGENDQLSRRPSKRQKFWVEVPRRKRALSVSVKQELSGVEVTAKAEGAAPVVKQEPDQEAHNALSIIRNVSVSQVSWGLDGV